MSRALSDADSVALQLAQVSSLTLAYSPNSADLRWVSLEPRSLAENMPMVQLEFTQDGVRKSHPLATSLVPVLAAWEALRVALGHTFLGTDGSHRRLTQLHTLLLGGSLKEEHLVEKYTALMALANSTPRGMVMHRKLLNEAVNFLTSHKLLVQENSLARLAWAEDNGVRVEHTALTVLSAHMDESTFRPVRADLLTAPERVLRQAILLFGTCAVPARVVQPHTWNEREPMEMLLLDYASLPTEFNLRSGSIPASEVEWDELLERFDSYLHDPLGTIEEGKNREAKRTRALFTPSTVLDVDLFTHKQHLLRDQNITLLPMPMVYRWASIHGDDLSVKEAELALSLLNKSYRLLLERNVRAHSSPAWKLFAGSSSN